MWTRCLTRPWHIVKDPGNCVTGRPVADRQLGHNRCKLARGKCCDPLSSNCSCNWHEDEDERASERVSERSIDMQGRRSSHSTLSLVLSPSLSVSDVSVLLHAAVNVSQFSAKYRTAWGRFKLRHPCFPLSLYATACTCECLGLHSLPLSLSFSVCGMQSSMTLPDKGRAACALPWNSLSAFLLPLSPSQLPLQHFPSLSLSLSYVRKKRSKKSMAEWEREKHHKICTIKLN